MTLRKTKKYNLDSKKTLPYFIDHVGCGKTLSDKILQKIDFEKGSFFTILPCNIESKQMFDFGHGGIIPSISYEKNGYQIKGFAEEFHPKKIVTMDQECSKLIASFLEKSDKNWAVVENYMLEPESPYARIESVRMVPFNSEVYYFLNGENSNKEIYETIRKSGQVWHFLAVLTHLEDSIPVTLTGEVIDKICEGAEFVIAGAYDGEGYIFWKK